jgi:hypothetical protein
LEHASEQTDSDAISDKLSKPDSRTKDDDALQKSCAPPRLALFAVDALGIAAAALFAHVVQAVGASF